MPIGFTSLAVYYNRKADKMKELTPEESIERKIFLLRGQKVMLSIHLAKLYELEISQNIFEAIRQLMAPPEKPKRRIGFY
jgi:hypothetical protein